MVLVLFFLMKRCIWMDIQLYGLPSVREICCGCLLWGGYCKLQKSWDALGFIIFGLYKTAHDRASMHSRTWNLPSHAISAFTLFSQITGTPFTNKGPDRYLGQVALFVALFTQINRMWGTYTHTSLQFVKSLEMWFIKLMYAPQRSEQAHTRSGGS